MRAFAESSRQKMPEKQEFLKILTGEKRARTAYHSWEDGLMSPAGSPEE